MEFRQKSAVAYMAAALLTATLAWAGHHESSAEFKVTPVDDNIDLLQGKGGNVAVLKGPEGLVLIDDDYSEMSPALAAALEPMGGIDKLTYVINTHWHGDHTGGNLALGEKSLIVAHDNVRSRLESPQVISLFGATSEPYPSEALPEITYSQHLTLHLNGEEIRIVHFPAGHTDGDSVVFFEKANVVHMGDHFFNGFFPFVDVENGGSVVGMAANVSAILDLIDDDTRVIPGHGPLSDRQGLAAFLAMLEGTTASVKAKMNEGLALDAIQAAGVDPQWKSWAGGFISEAVWLQLVSDSLTKSGKSKQ